MRYLDKHGRELGKGDKVICNSGCFGFEEGLHTIVGFNNYNTLVKLGVKGRGHEALGHTLDCGTYIVKGMFSGVYWIQHRDLILIEKGGEIREEVEGS